MGAMTMQLVNFDNTNVCDLFFSKRYASPEVYVSVIYKHNTNAHKQFRFYAVFFSQRKTEKPKHNMKILKPIRATSWNSINTLRSTFPFRRKKIFWFFSVFSTRTNWKTGRLTADWRISKKSTATRKKNTKKEKQCVQHSRNLKQRTARSSRWEKQKKQFDWIEYNN